MVIPSAVLPVAAQFDLSLRLGVLTRQLNLASRNGDVQSLGRLALELLALKSRAEHRLQSSTDPGVRKQAQRVLDEVHKLEDRITTLYLLRQVRNRVARDPLLLGAASTRATSAAVNP